MKKLLLLLIYLFVQNASFAQKICFYNGKIYTVDARSSVVEAVVVENGKIIFVGSTPEARAAWSDSRTKMVDLGGKLMLPGFIDNHTHFADGGMYLLGIDLRGAKSTTQFKEIIKKYVESHRGEWIKSGNWDHESWEVKELPTKEMIDDFSKDTPIFIDRFDGHMGLANSKALALAGITKDTKSPDGGEIVKDPKTGEPTGILKDAAMTLIYSIIPRLTPDQKIKCVQRALQEAYEKDDLFELLRLKIELQNSDIESITMDDEQLRYYNKIVKEQVSELERNLLEVRKRASTSMEGTNLFTKFGGDDKTMKLKFSFEINRLRKNTKELEQNIAVLRGQESMRRFLKDFNNDFYN